MELRKENIKQSSKTWTIFLQYVEVYLPFLLAAKMKGLFTEDCTHILLDKI